MPPRSYFVDGGGKSVAGVPPRSVGCGRQYKRYITPPRENRTYFMRIRKKKRRRKKNKEPSQNTQNSTRSHSKQPHDAAVCGRSSLDGLYLVGLVPCYHPVCHLLRAVVNNRIFPTTTVAPFLPIPSHSTRNGCLARPTLLCFILVLPDHEQFGCSEDPPLPLTRVLCSNWPQRSLDSKQQRGALCGSLGG